jgi:signal transduction histidine kinase
VTAVLQGSVWRFGVRDNGIGIEAEHGEQIFEMFKRLHSREMYPGTGAGLAICARIVERHGGMIWLSEPTGRGAEILFTLPAESAVGPVVVEGAAA